MKDLVAMILTQARTHGIEPMVFAALYVLSFLPVYGGLYIMLKAGLGKRAELDRRDIRLFRNRRFITGLALHLFGWVLPYGYVLLFGLRLPFLIYAVVVLALGIGLYRFLGQRREMAFSGRFGRGITLQSEERVEDPLVREQMWVLYDNCFGPSNHKSPCRQSFHREDFMAAVGNPRVRKYLAFAAGERLVGLGMITSDFSCLPWISEEYFARRWPEHHRGEKIFYHMGIAVDPACRGVGIPVKITDQIFRDVPSDALFGFDHSVKSAPFVPLISRVSNGFAGKVKREKIDNQAYYLIRKVG